MLLAEIYCEMLSFDAGQNPRRPEFWGAWYGDTCRTTAYCLWHSPLWGDFVRSGWEYKTIHLPFSAHNTELRKIKSPDQGSTNCTLYDLRRTLKKEFHIKYIWLIIPTHIVGVRSRTLAVPHTKNFLWLYCSRRKEKTSNWWKTTIHWKGMLVLWRRDAARN